MAVAEKSGKDKPTSQIRRAVPIVEVYPYSITMLQFNVFKYCYVSETIQLNITNLLTHT